MRTEGISTQFITLSGTKLAIKRYDLENEECVKENKSKVIIVLSDSDSYASSCEDILLFYFLYYLLV